MITGIVVALPEELSTLTSANIEKGRYFQFSDSILIALAGAGPDNASKAAQLLLSQGVEALISWGCAAALSPEAKPGDLVLPDALIKDAATTADCDNAWTKHCANILQNELTLSSGTLAGSDDIVASSADKSALHQRTHAIALDMESHAVVSVANEAGIPGLVIRAIADPAAMSLPDAVSLSLTPDGDVKLGVLLSHVLRHPLQIPELIKLGLYFNAAKKSLRSVTVNLDKITEFSH